MPTCTVSTFNNTEVYWMLEQIKTHSLSCNFFVEYLVNLYEWFLIITFFKAK